MRSVGLEMRWLKYELLSQTDMDSARSSDNLRAYSKKGFGTIFHVKRVVELTKIIYYTSYIFQDSFEKNKTQAIDVLEYIDKIYGDRKVNTMND